MNRKQETIKKAVEDDKHDSDTLDKRFSIDDKNGITRSLDTINYTYPGKYKYPKLHKHKSKESDTKESDAKESDTKESDTNNEQKK